VDIRISAFGRINPEERIHCPFKIANDILLLIQNPLYNLDFVYDVVEAFQILDFCDELLLDSAGAFVAIKMVISKDKSVGLVISIRRSFVFRVKINDTHKFCN
jgi:hypothetical protein